MSCLSCTATGAPRSSASWSFIASRPTPAALRRAPSISPGGLFGTGRRASGAVAAFGGSGRAGSGLFRLTSFESLTISFFTGAGGGGGVSRSSSSFASRGGSSCGAARSMIGGGMKSITRHSTTAVASTRFSTRRKRASSAGTFAHGSTGMRNETIVVVATAALMSHPSCEPRTTCR